MRRWIDERNPTPRSTLVYQAADGEDTVLRIEVTTAMPGSFIELTRFPADGRLLLNANEADGLARRLAAMAERTRI